MVFMCHIIFSNFMTRRISYLLLILKKIFVFFFCSRQSIFQSLNATHKVLFVPSLKLSLGVFNVVGFQSIMVTHSTTTATPNEFGALESSLSLFLGPSVNILDRYFLNIEFVVPTFVVAKHVGADFRFVIPPIFFLLLPCLTLLTPDRCCNDIRYTPRTLPFARGR